MAFESLPSLDTTTHLSSLRFRVPGHGCSTTSVWNKASRTVWFRYASRPSCAFGTAAQRCWTVTPLSPPPSATGRFENPPDSQARLPTFQYRYFALGRYAAIEPSMLMRPALRSRSTSWLESVGHEDLNGSIDQAVRRRPDTKSDAGCIDHAEGDRRGHVVRGHTYSGRSILRTPQRGDVTSAGSGSVKVTARYPD